MTEKIFDKYSAREFLDWLSDEVADEYIKQEIEDDGFDTVITDLFDMEQLKKNFLYHIKRYTVIKRGYKFYIHDERSCRDIMMFEYTDNNRTVVENYVQGVCDDLNKGKIHFVGKKHWCD